MVREGHRDWDIRDIREKATEELAPGTTSRPDVRLGGDGLALVAAPLVPEPPLLLGHQEDVEGRGPQVRRAGHPVCGVRMGTWTPVSAYLCLPVCPSVGAF